MQLELADQTLYPFSISLLVLPALISSQAAELDAQEVVWAGLEIRGVVNMRFEEYREALVLSVGKGGMARTRVGVVAR